MNAYKLTFYFSDKINIETSLYSELEVTDFVSDFSNGNHDKKFIAFINKDGLIINLDKVMYYTIKLVQVDMTSPGEQRWKNNNR